MKKTNVRDMQKEKYWRAALERREATGVSAREFCRQENLKAHLFHYWQREIHKRDAELQKPKSKAKASLVPVRVVDAKAQAPSTSAEFIEIVTADGLCIRVPLTCSGSVVSELVAGLRRS